MINEFMALNGQLRCVESMKVVSDVVNITLINGKVVTVKTYENGERPLYVRDTNTERTVGFDTVAQAVKYLGELSEQPFIYTSTELANLLWERKATTATVTGATLDNIHGQTTSRHKVAITTDKGVFYAYVDLSQFVYEYNNENITGRPNDLVIWHINNTFGESLRKALKPVKEFDDVEQLHEWAMNDDGVTSLEFIALSYGNFNDMTGQLFTLTAKTNLGLITVDSNSTYIEEVGYDEETGTQEHVTDEMIISYFNEWIGLAVADKEI